MTILAAQSIRKLCVPNIFNNQYKSTYHNSTLNRCVEDYTDKPLIAPFVERGTQNGKSYGLSACTYDCRISDGLIIPVGQSRLASTIERFCFPNNICGSVLDKSSWARIFITAFNTHLDPGWEGYLTVELANLGTEAAIFEPGDPICQIKFEWLDQPTDLPYSGKYQHQQAGPQKARNE